MLTGGQEAIAVNDANEKLQKNIKNFMDLMTFNTAAGQRQLPVIDILSAISGKLGAFYARQQRNDYQDIVFLIWKVP